MYFDTIIIGTGCAGYNAADWLYELGHRNIAIVTEGRFKGTSRNTGSDKQTYYKLSLASDGGDSVCEMAQALFSGGSMHGDHALIEAACSAKSFIKLALLGVPFPTTKYGEYVGYKTDHDPKRRATSCGPLTSKLMTEALENSVKRKNITIFDNTQAIEILVSDGKVTGLAAIDTLSFEYRVFGCQNIIMATGGPSGIYKHSVFPESQTGAAGLALNVGASAQNLCDWQYGITSTKFRWCLSGAYHQVLPRYFSIDAKGQEHELETDLNSVFLKGYQWPFDVRKTGGSSGLDMMVHSETGNGNRVFIDYRQNPAGLDFGALCDEAKSYLENTGVMFGTPFERLMKMNPAAVSLYRSHGIDLAAEPLEVAVCAQHCNGGVAVDSNWESSISGLYAVGEAAGTHGLYRPGGSALNSGQVGSMRAAEHISRKEVAPAQALPTWTPPTVTTGASGIKPLRTGDMSKYAGFKRNIVKMQELLTELQRAKSAFWQENTITCQSELPTLHKNFDLLSAQIAVLSAMIYSAQTIGSRGSGYVEGSTVADEGKGVVIMTVGNESSSRPVRPLPECGGWFETVWREFNIANQKHSR